MSYAGAVYDMIRRNKQNREALKNRRNQIEKNKNKAYPKKTLSPNTNLSSEELERINQNIKKRESEEERHLFLVQIIFLGILVIILLVILIINLTQTH